MGGKALKHTETRRYDLEEYTFLCARLLPKLEKIFKTEVSLVESFSNKKDFGDMDVLVLGKRDNSVVKQLLIDNFDPKPGEIKCNGHVTSFEHKEFQIDLIFTDEENWETSKLFFKYGDLSNLLGKMYHKVNLKYGWNGLRMVIRDENDSALLGNMLISKDPKKMFEFMGLSWERYLEGFEEEKDVFDFIIQSRFFDPEAFKLENLNHVNKKRNKRRKGYNSFIKYVEDLKVIPKYTFDETDKTSHVKEIEDYFNVEIYKEIDRLQAEDNIKKEIRKKFNGKHVMDWANVKPGPLVAKHIEGFKRYIGKYFNNYILNNHQDNIMIDFLTYFNK